MKKLKEGKQAPTELELILSKRLRELSKGDKVFHKDALIMQDMYFDISDNGICDNVRVDLKRLVLTYGNKKDREAATFVEINSIRKDGLDYKNIYAAVDVLSKSDKIFYGQRMNTNDVKQVLKMVCDLMKVPLDVALSKSRKKDHIKCRAITAYLVYSKTQVKTISQTMNRDHSSVIHYIRIADGMLIKDDNLRKIYKKVKIETGL